MDIAAIEDRAARLARNPHNIHSPRFGGGMCNFDYWAARFEREGMQADSAARNPYNRGVMAWEAWERGRAYARLGEGRAA